MVTVGIKHTTLSVWAREHISNRCFFHCHVKIFEKSSPFCDPFLNGQNAKWATKPIWSFRESRKLQVENAYSQWGYKPSPWKFKIQDQPKWLVFSMIHGSQGFRTPQKTNGWNLKNHSFEKENHPPNPHFEVPSWFSGVHILPQGQSFGPP